MPRDYRWREIASKPEGRFELVLSCVGSDCKRRKTKAKDERKAIIDRHRISVEGNGEAMWKYCAQIILSSLKLETTALNNLCRGVADLSCAEGVWDQAGALRGTLPGSS